MTSPFRVDNNRMGDLEVFGPGTALLAEIPFVPLGQRDVLDIAGEEWRDCRVPRNSEQFLS